MAAKTFRCRLITPEAQVLDADATAAVLPAWDGSMGVLPDRAAIVAKLGIGELRLDFPDTAKGEGGSRAFFVDGGFAQMVNNKLTVLASTAIPAETLTERDAQAELAEAESRRIEDVADPVQREKLRHERERARHKVRLAKTFRGRGI